MPTELPTFNSQSSTPMPPEVITETITLDPPIQVSESVIQGGMIVNTADIIEQPDPTQLVAAIYGDGRVIGVPFVNDAEISLRTALE